MLMTSDDRDKRSFRSGKNENFKTLSRYTRLGKKMNFDIREEFQADNTFGGINTRRKRWKL